MDRLSRSGQRLPAADHHGRAAVQQGIGRRHSSPMGTQTSAGGAPSRTPITLPFDGLKDPQGVAVNSEGDVDVADASGVSKLSAGAKAATALPFHTPGSVGVAVDGAGNVYTVDYVNDRVLELAAVRQSPVSCPSRV